MRCLAPTCTRLRVLRCCSWLAAILAAAALPRTAWSQATPVSAKGVEQPQAYFEFQVDKPVLPWPSNRPPHYPDAISVHSHGGEVEVSFVVDSTGHADVSTFKVLSTSDAACAQSVRDALPGMRFYPAEAEGRRVKQLVRQVFRFPPT